MAPPRCPSLTVPPPSAHPSPSICVPGTANRAVQLGLSRGQNCSAQDILGRAVLPQETATQPCRAQHPCLHSRSPHAISFLVGERQNTFYIHLCTSSVSLIGAPHIREQCRLQCVFPYTILPLAVSDRTDLVAPQAGRTPAWLTDCGEQKAQLSSHGGILLALTAAYA